MSYKLTNGTAVVRVGDAAVIPADPDNTDWRTYKAWLAAGNVPSPADPLVIPYTPPTPREWINRLSIETKRALLVARRNDLDLDIMVTDLLGASFVDTNDHDVVLGVSLMQTAGLLTAQEAELLLAP